MKTELFLTQMLIEINKFTHLKFIFYYFLLKFSEQNSVFTRGYKNDWRELFTLLILINF